MDINRSQPPLAESLEAFTELHVRSSVNAMMPLPTNQNIQTLGRKNIYDHFGKSVRAENYCFAARTAHFMQEQICCHTDSR